MVLLIACPSANRKLEVSSPLAVITNASQWVYFSFRIVKLLLCGVQNKRRTCHEMHMFHSPSADFWMSFERGTLRAEPTSTKDALLAGYDGGNQPWEAAPLIQFSAGSRKKYIH